MNLTPTPTVLVVDDDTLMRALVRDLLSAEGFHVLQARSGREALDVLKLQRIQLLVLDGLLPDGAGPDWLARHDEKVGDVPRILLSAFWRGLSAQREVREQVGIHAFVAKPLKPGPFVSLVRSLLGLTPVAVPPGLQPARPSNEARAA